MHRAVSVPEKGQLSISIGDFANPQVRSDTTGPLLSLACSRAFS